MTKSKIIFVAFLLLSFSGKMYAEKIELNELYIQLRNAIDSIPVYDSNQQKKIGILKERLKATHKHSEQGEICQKLFEAYSKFCYDSAAVYLDRSLEYAEMQGNKEKETELTLLQARYYGKAGSYVEALHLINNIKEEEIPSSLHALYIDAMRSIYVETGNSLHQNNIRKQYLSKSAEYRTVLFEIEDSTSLPILNLREGKARYEHNYDEALYLSDCQLHQIHPDTPEFSETAFFRSCTYRDMGQYEMQKYWLLLSALSDIRCSIKDQASLWSLAAILAKEGDTELSYLLIRTSHDGLSFYNAPLRYLQSVNILSMIDHNYQIMTTEQNSTLRWLLWTISLLAIMLLGSLLYIFRQMKRLNGAQLLLHNTNEELKTVNRQLSVTVESLNTSNNLLKESNTVKDAYIGRFLSQTSEYMKKLESFRATVLKKEKSGQLIEYLSPSRMREIKTQELAEFTNDFDKAFLHLIPNFIEEFNELLKPEGRIIPNEQNTLTTELRIFALIRLGINDSSKIAEFLHYSVQTIYNYRSTVKNMAIGDRNKFEEKVREIGNLNDHKGI